MKPKLTNDQVREIQAATGTTTELAKEYGVHYTSIRAIQKRLRNPRPEPVEAEQHTSGEGTVIDAELIALSKRRPSGRYWVTVRFPSEVGAAIVALGKLAVSNETKSLREAGDADALPADHQPYASQANGEWLVNFESFSKPRLRNAEGNDLRKPELLSKGRHVRVVYSAATQNRAYDPERVNRTGIDRSGIACVLKLHEIIAFSGKTRETLT